TDTADLSADIRYLWDDEYLYIGAVVTDDTHVADKRDGSLWNMDGLQFLVDVNRAGKEKSGQYDISFGHGTNGPQVWCHTSGSSTIPAGEITTGKLTVIRDDAARTTTYEFALPWARLAPFRPSAGANIGLALIVNDNDGDGRYFVGWFSGVHSK